jgi:hypothetical protein
MGSPVVTQATTVICGHGGSATVLPTQVRVRVAGAPAEVSSGMPIVAGCGLTGTPTAPCVVLTWTVPALRVKAGGQPLVLHSSQPMGVGPAQIVAGQMRVTAQ